MRQLLPFAVAALAAACAPPPGDPAAASASAGPARQCFPAGSMNSFRIVDRDTVDLTIGPNEVWRVELFGSCLGLEETMSLGVAARGGSSLICHGGEATILVPRSAVGPQRCHARTVRRLTPEETAAERAHR